MGKRSPLERLLRRVLIIVLVALAAAAVYLWMFRGVGEAQDFNRIYQASVTQASDNLMLEATLGLPISAAEDQAQHDFYDQDDRRHVRFHYPLAGPRGAAMIEGEAIKIGRNWLIVKLVATFADGDTLDLTSNVTT